MHYYIIIKRIVRKQEIMMNNTVKDGVSISYSAIADVYRKAQ